MTDTELAIRGRSVILRTKSIEDAEDDYRWRIDDELAELDATSPIRVSLQEFRRILQDELRHPTPWVRRYGIDTHGGLHIGNCMFYDIDTASGEGELGIMLGDRDYWGKGYGTDAMAHLVEECFKMPSMKRLYLHTLVWNERARKAFSKCGFQEVQEVRRSGHDFLLMEVTRESWEQLRASLLNVTASAG